MVSIRKASLEDIEDIHLLETLIFNEGSYPMFVLRQLYDISHDYFYVAEEHQQRIGYVLGNVVKSTNQGWILSLGVHPDARGNNLGRELIKQLLETLEHELCTEICLTVHPGNTSAIRIYGSLGFINSTTYDAYYGANEPRLLMKKILMSQPFNT